MELRRVTTWPNQPASADSLAAQKARGTTGWFSKPSSVGIKGKKEKCNLLTRVLYPAHHVIILFSPTIGWLWRSPSRLNYLSWMVGIATRAYSILCDYHGWSRWGWVLQLMTLWDWTQRDCIWVVFKVGTWIYFGLERHTVKMGWKALYLWKGAGRVVSDQTSEEYGLHS